MKGKEEISNIFPSPRKTGSIDDDILLDKKEFGISAMPLDNKKDPTKKPREILLPCCAGAGFATMEHEEDIIL